MTKEKIKRLLESYKYDVQLFNEKLKDVNKLKNDISKLAESNKVYKMSQISSTEIENNFNSFIERQIVEENKLLTILNKKQKIEEYINKLPQPYQTIFYLKYISLMSFEEIAETLNYSIKRIYQLHNEGLATLMNNSTENLSKNKIENI